DKLITSRLNYFLRDKDNYVGVYAKYFIKTDTSDNSNTLQELPSLHYHRFLSPLLFNNLQYSFDTQYNNYYRKKGVKAQQLEMNLPVTFSTSFFDEFLRFNISENLYFMRVDYDNFNKNIMSDDFGQYLSNYHKISLYTDLAKAYDPFLHKIYFGLDYIVPSFENKKGYLDRNDFVQISAEIRQVRLKFKQYFYDTDGNKRVIHSITQPYYIDEYDEKYRPLENRMELFLTSGITLNNEIHYSHDKGTPVKSSSSLKIKGDKYLLDFSHTYDKYADNNFFSLDYEHNIFKNNYLYTGVDYDFKENYTKSWYAGFKFPKKCWDYAIIYKEDVTPKLTSSGKARAESKQGVYLTFNLFPIGGVKYDFSTTSSRDL
ncbi:MAG: LPS assembly protein LptD, partial [Campylobacteraceae bacterium]|nr:LPS assembly protein LptD [Campylobacteraceae bacterium]